jgi:hypothetical protein
MKLLYPILILFVALSIFSACEKERGEAIACMNTGTATYEAGKIIRFMNCSKNYDGTKWYVIRKDDDMKDTIYVEPTDTLKHLQFVFTPDTFEVVLDVWQADSISQSNTSSEQFIILP